MQISTATTLFLINWILKFQQGMILLLQCQQSSSLEPALSGRDVKNEKSICFCRGWGSRSAGLATTCSLPPPLATALRCCWHTRVDGVLKPSSQQKEQRTSFFRTVICFCFSLSVISFAPAPAWFRLLPRVPEEQGEEPGWLSEEGHGGGQVQGKDRTTPD